MSCSSTNCSHEIFHNGLCIFHCNKDSWYITRGKIRDWNTDLLNLFWTRFHDLIKKQTFSDCTNFVFPETDYDFGLDTNSYNTVYQLRDCNLTDINFNGSTFLTSPSFIGCTLEKCSFRNCKANSILFISCNLNSCNFQGIPINDISIDGSEIENSNFQWISIDKMSMQASKITNSNFNNSSFQSLDLSDSYAKNCSFQNTKVYSGTLDTYRIIKHYHDEVKNDIEASQYYAREMREYCKNVLISPYFSIKAVIRTLLIKSKNSPMKDKFESQLTYYFKQFLKDLKSFFSEGPILLFNFVISNFGQNWFMPLIWFGVTSILIFNAIKIQTSFDINQFAMFINPFLTSTSTEVYKEHYALWLTHKILETIFLYHFIVAIKQKTRRVS